MRPISVRTVDQLMRQARFRQSFKALPKGKVFKDLSTVIIVPVVGAVNEKASLNCKKCKAKNDYTQTVIHGISPIVVESWKRLIKPMNVPVIEMMVSGLEVGQAYTQAIETVLASPALRNFKYILTMESDNIVPFIPNSQGPLMMLYEDIERGFDAAGGLYWTKGCPSLPLIYGDPKESSDAKSGMFKVRHDWRPGDIVECNGLGMGFTLFKMSLFKDSRISKPWFKTVNENNKDGVAHYTQDLYFFEKIRKLGYRVCVDTRVRLGHLDAKSGVIY